MSAAALRTEGPGLVSRVQAADSAREKRLKSISAATSSYSADTAVSPRPLLITTAVQCIVEVIDLESSRPQYGRNLTRLATQT